MGREMERRGEDYSWLRELTVFSGELCCFSEFYPKFLKPDKRVSGSDEFFTLSESGIIDGKF